MAAEFSDTTQPPWRARLIHKGLLALKRFQSPTPPLDFRKSFGAARHLLFILPDNRNLCLKLSAFLPEIGALFPVGKRSVLLSDACRDAVPDMDCLIYKPEDRTFLSLPSSQLIAQIKVQQFDLIISLLPDFDLFTAYLSLHSKIMLRVTFQAPCADHYFNMIVCPDSNSELNVKMDSLVKYLRMVQPMVAQNSR